MFRYQPSSCSKISFADLILSRYWNSNGEYLFKTSLKSMVPKKHIITNSSFMRSIYFCLSYIKSKHHNKKKILLPRYSCMTFAHAIRQAGLEIVYCDQNPSNFKIDYDSLEKQVDSEVLGLISVNLLGLTNDMSLLKKFCNSKEIYLIEDLGYSLGSKFNNKNLGSFGDFSVANFKEGKPLPISGGMVATDDSDFVSFIGFQNPQEYDFLRVALLYFLFFPFFYFLFRKLMQITNIDFRRRFSSEDTLISSNNEYDFFFDEISADVKISLPQFELGQRILQTMESQILMRNFISSIYYRAFVNLKSISCVETDKNDFVHYIRYPILVNTNRDKLLKVLNQNGIEATDLYQTLEEEIDDYPGSKTIKEKILTLPCHPNMHKSDLIKTIRIVKSFALKQDKKNE